MADSQEVHTVTNEHGDRAVLSYAPLDPAAIEASLRSESDGAVVCFVGYTRDNFQGRKVTHLTYEAYVPLARKTLRALLLELRSLPPPAPFSHAASSPCCAPSAPPGERIDLGRISVAHLLGPSPPKTPSIVIAVSSPHRREAFFAAEWMLERVKERVQVWKREWYADEGAEFVGRDGEGPQGRGGRAGEATWKENFPPAAAAPARSAAGGCAHGHGPGRGHGDAKKAEEEGEEVERARG
ncbi:hypothetical protein JCM10449v2_000002 [Rhodotorula kratochvilovae]